MLSITNITVHLPLFRPPLPLSLLPSSSSPLPPSLLLFSSPSSPPPLLLSLLLPLSMCLFFPFPSSPLFLFFSILPSPSSFPPPLFRFSSSLLFSSPLLSSPHLLPSPLFLFLLFTSMFPVSPSTLLLPLLLPSFPPFLVPLLFFLLSPHPISLLLSILFSLLPFLFLKKPQPSKPSLAQRIWDAAVHSYHGFRLLALDIRVAFRLLRKTLRGNALTRREQKQVCG